MNNTHLEDSHLARVRNVGMDVQAIMHMTNSYLSGEKEWSCHCIACEYVRRDPRVVDAFARSIVKSHKNT